MSLWSTAWSLQEDHDVVACLDLGVDRALEPCQSPVERDRAVVADPHGHPDEPVLGNAGELTAHGALVIGQDCHPEVCRTP